MAYGNTKPAWSGSLVVDDFGIKYVRRENWEYFLMTPIKKYYAISSDWKGSAYSGLKSIGTMPMAMLPKFVRQI
jgi:hypothetical protein